MQEKMSRTRKSMPSPNKGKKFSEEWRKNLSLAHKGQRSGADCNLWKGGIYTYERRLWHARQRRVKKLGNGGSHTQGEWETLKAQYNWTCPSCYKQEPDIVLTADHIVPLIKGGSDNIENIQPLCKSCNCKKHTRTIKY